MARPHKAGEPINPRECQACGKAYAPKRDYLTKYCSDNCRSRMSMRRHRAAVKARAAA